VERLEDCGNLLNSPASPLRGIRVTLNTRLWTVGSASAHANNLKLKYFSRGFGAIIIVYYAEAAENI